MTQKSTTYIKMFNSAKYYTIQGHQYWYQLKLWKAHIRPRISELNQILCRRPFSSYSETLVKLSLLTGNVSLSCTRLS